MHVVFVDDSKQKGRREAMGNLITLGAVAFAEDKVRPFAEAFNARLDEFDVPREVELKWSPDSKTDWFRKNKKTSIIAPLREAILADALAHGCRVVAAVWDDELAGLGMRNQTAEQWVIRFLFERVEMMLQNEGHRGILVFDKPGGDHRAEDAWLGETADLTSIGTEFVKSEAIVIPVLTAPSHRHPHLQLADLVTGVVTAALAGSKYGMALANMVTPMFHRNYYGGIGGAGLKLYPDSLLNLLHWVFEEERFVRNGMGFALPAPALGRFGENDGLAPS
ncbi:DUF3800 domain-containing protein [Arenivirga flava]|nr:DUF3800 domain-containing protein [Arenivirga flava]